MKLSDEAKAAFRAIDKRVESAATHAEKYNESLREKTENVQPLPNLLDPIEKVSDRIRKRKERGFFGRLFGLNIKF